LIHILGTDFSERIDGLVKQIEDLSSHKVAFDNEISPSDEKWNKVNGIYRSASKSPRISLKPHASEETVAHELLHGILHYKGFPALASGNEDIFPFANEVANEILHIGLHSVIDEIMTDMGYNLAIVKTSNLRERTDALKSICSQPGDEGWRVWWTVRVACQGAYNKMKPEVENAAEVAFEEQVGKAFPLAIALIQKIVGILGRTNRHDQCLLQEGLRGVLFHVRDQFPNYPGIRNAEGKVVFTPLYVKAKQISRPADKLLMLTTKSRYNASGERTGDMIVLSDRRHGGAVAICLAKEPAGDRKDADKDLARELQMTKRLLKTPLRNVLSHCGIRFQIIENLPKV